MNAKEGGTDRETRPLIVAVDDDPRILKMMERVLGSSGEYRFVGVDRPNGVLALLENMRPDLFLLDVRLPEMSGYELCARLLAREESRYTPVVFATGLGDEEDRARGFAAGAAEIITKPFQPDDLRRVVEQVLRAESQWKALRGAPRAAGVQRLFAPTAWSDFKTYLRSRVEPRGEAATALAAAKPDQLYDLTDTLGVTDRVIARMVADFLDAPTAATIEPARVVAGILPAAFCRANLVVPILTEGGTGAALSNPFNMQLLEALARVVWKARAPDLVIAEPDVVRSFFTFSSRGEEGGHRAGEDAAPRLDADRVAECDGAVVDVAQLEIASMANELLRGAVRDRASDLHVEPKRDHAVVRVRIDGDLEEVRRISNDQSRRLITRFKALSKMDIAERRKPQDGALEAMIRGRLFKLRLATAATPHGESIVVRFVEPFVRPPSLEALGASHEQAETLRDFMARSAGLVLVVGPTGSGKSTTIFSLLDMVGGDRRSIITVEDPVEYRIPFANQQQVDEKAGATFEALLRSAVRQDPDILLLGEVRDLFSAKASLDFSSSGHLTISSMHSANSTTAIFRMERLGIQRGAMADAMLGVVAQKLMKRLCRQCRRVRPITAEEVEWLRPFAAELPEDVAEPLGCPACRGTGFLGRTGVYEVLRFDPQVARAVREGASISHIRDLVADRGDVLIGSHAVEKVASLDCSPRQIYETVLLEEMRREPDGERGSVAPAATPERRRTAPVRPDGHSAPAASPAGPDPSGCGDAAPPDARILLVEDDLITRSLIERFLTGAHYEVVAAGDGAEALLHLGSDRFDLVLSDINMPNLDGIKLVEIMTQNGVTTPVVFLTGQSGEDAEAQSLELGVEDFIRKPVKKDVLRLRVGRILERQRGLHDRESTRA